MITLEGWSKIMYYLQDAYSQWVWIYFVALIVVSIFFTFLFYCHSYSIVNGIREFNMYSRSLEWIQLFVNNGMYPSQSVS